MTATTTSLPSTSLRLRPITMAILAMGGEGGGVLSDWIVAVAEKNGYYAQSTSVPGVAQRTGATVYYVELFPKFSGSERHSEPVLSTMPTPGEVDIVVASELMEAGRSIQRGFSTPDRTTLIASTSRTYAMPERTAMGDGRIDSGRLIEAALASSKRFIRGDFAKIAQDTGSVISAVLLGAIAGAGVLPFTREQFEEAIRASGKGVEPSLLAFAEGFTVAAKPAGQSIDITIGARPSETRARSSDLAYKSRHLASALIFQLRRGSCSSMASSAPPSTRTSTTPTSISIASPPSPLSRYTATAATSSPPRPPDIRHYG